METLEPRAPITWPDATIHALDRVIRAGGTALLLGGTDSGKSTLVRELANRALAAGRRVGIVDADVGQSDIGPPTTIGFGLIDAPIALSGPIHASRLYFVGDTTPARHLLPAVLGTALMVRAARAHRCDLILVDTTGMVSGRLASTLKFHKIQAVQPRTLVAIQKHLELEGLLAPFAGPGGPRIVRLPVPPGAQTRPPHLRRENRRQAWVSYLTGAREQVLDRSAVALWPAIPPDRLSDLRHRVCGLLDAWGMTLAVGVLHDADPYSLTLLTPLHEVGDVATVQVGALRLRDDGEELGHASPRPGAPSQEDESDRAEPLDNADAMRYTVDAG